jgi:hypothetical protein
LLFDEGVLPVAAALVDCLAEARRELPTATGERRLQIIEDMAGCAQLLTLTLQHLVDSDSDGVRVLPVNYGTLPRVLH